MHDVAVLEHHAQTAVSLAAGFGDHAVDHFTLEHEVLAAALKDGRPVEFQGVGLDERELLGGELLAQKLGEVAVDLDGGFVACAGDDFARERGLARADFNESVARLRVDAAHDALDPVAVMKEVLTEAFAGLCPSSHSCFTVLR